MGVLGQKPVGSLDLIQEFFADANMILVVPSKCLSHFGVSKRFVNDLKGHG